MPAGVRLDHAPVTPWRAVSRVGEIREPGNRWGFVVTVEIRRESGIATTTDHQTIVAPLCLSVTGEVVKGRGTRDGDWLAGGQVVDMLTDITDYSPGWSAEEAGRLAGIWRAWHLNTMRPGCVHHDPAALVREPDRWSPGGTRVATGAANACPVTGYGWGTSSWLTEPLPGTVIGQLSTLMRDRSRELYAARGYDAAGHAV